MKMDKEGMRKLKASMANIVLFLSIFSVMSLVLITMNAPNASAATWDVYPGPGTPLQDAIDDASAGDTILVHAGLYQEIIQVDKTLTIIGDSKTNTIIDAEQRDTVISISASSVTVTGFNITNGDPHGIHMTPDNDNNKIWDCDITNNVNSGIFLESSDDNEIYGNNNIWDNEYGINLNGTSGSHNNKIKDCDIYNNDYGMYLNSSSGSNENYIFNNDISENTKTGLKISNSIDNTVLDNDMLNNGKYGISILNSKDNYIWYNYIYDNLDFGLYIEGDYRNYISENNTINGDNISYIYNKNGTAAQLNDTIQNKTMTADKVTNVGKITFIECSYFYVANNTISNATKGIFLYNSHNITLDDNTIYDIDEEGEYGLYIEGDYRHNITQNNSVNGESIYYYYNITGSESNPIEVESGQPLDASHVSNVGKISVIDSSYLLIRNNSLSYGFFGIFLYGSQELTLWNNTISDSEEVGLHITGGYHHYIPQNNTVKGEDGGWENISYYTDENDKTVENLSLDEHRINNVGKLTFINCTNITITNNSLKSASWDAKKKKFIGGDGIFLYYSDNCTINDTTFYENDYGIRLIGSNWNNITNCSLSNQNGISFESSNNNTVDNCTHYYRFTTGIRIKNSNNITIANSTMNPHFQSTIGIDVLESQDITILKNTFNVNDTYNGLGRGVRGTSSEIVIKNNTFYRNGTGIIISLNGCKNHTEILDNDINIEFQMSLVRNTKTALTVTIYMVNSSPLIENNTSNHSYIPPDVSRPKVNNHQNIGHMAVYQSSTPIIKNNYFYGSSWGISLENKAWALIDNNTIEKTDIALGVASKPSNQLGSGENLSNTASFVIVNNTKILSSHSWGINFNPFNSGNVTNCTISNTSGIGYGRGINIKGKASQYIAYNNFSYNDIGIKSYPDGPYPIIFNNTFVGNDEGIHIENSSLSLKIENNTVTNNTYGIIGYSIKNYIANNTLLSNSYGIYVGDGSSPYILYNEIKNNTNGIYVFRANNVTIDNNNQINENDYGVRLRQSDNNQITNNTFYNNEYDALRFELSDGNHISGNEIKESKNGIYLTSCNNTNITGNSKINNNTDYGITITGLIGGDWADSFENDSKIESSSYIDIVDNHAELNLENLILDNFDADPTGQPPVNWINTSTGGASALVNESVFNGTSGKSVKFYDPDNGNISAITRNFNETGGIIADFYAKAEQTSGSFIASFGNGSNPNLIRVGFGSNGKFTYYDEEWKFLSDYNTSWHHFKVISHRNTYSYDVYINEEKVIEDAELAENYLNFEIINFSTSPSSIGTFYLDDINVTNAYGYIISKCISIPVNQAWYTLTINRSKDKPNTCINVAILDNSTLKPISGFKDIIGTEIDIYRIDPIFYPEICLKAEFIANIPSTPLLYDWEVIWADDPDPTHATNITGNEINNNNIGIYINCSNNITITENNITNNALFGIHLSSSNDNKIGMNNISSNTDGINLTNSSNCNLITNNYLANNTNYALYMVSSSDNEIIDNDLEYSNYGAYLTSCNNNTLYHNNLKNNTLNNASDDGTNKWDNGLEGNWWGNNSSPTDSDGDGICDASFPGTGFVDNKPLANEDNDRVLVDDPWFWFIQSGINFAEPGWTVYATASTYLENVTINKTLTVIGENKSTTIIDARGNDSVILVDGVSYVNISGFTVKNGTHGISLNIKSNFTHIFNNNVINNTLLGINISQSSNVTIENNTISYNENGLISNYSSPIIRYNNISNNNNTGIRGIYHSDAIVCNNTITYNHYGILDFEYSNGTIDNNTISYNYHGIVCGNYSCPIITYNNITFNEYGIDCKIGSNVTVHWNNIHNSTYYELKNGDRNIIINAIDNYWGKPTGPVLGDDIQGPGAVIYIPFETSPIDEAGPQ